MVGVPGAHRSCAAATASLTNVGGNCYTAR
jgi:hypothetical protein